jgi:protein-tyrosine kinase
LFSSRMEVTLGEMMRRFPGRFIILDTPPCMVSSDAATMAPLVGQIVFVVEAYRTQQDEIEASLSMLSACPRISLVLNKSEQGTAHFGSYAYGYDYHYYPSEPSNEPRRDRSAPA